MNIKYPDLSTSQSAYLVTIEEGTSPYSVFAGRRSCSLSRSLGVDCRQGNH